MLYIRVLYVLERSTLSFNCFFAAELEKVKCLMKSLPATVTAYLTLPLHTPLPLSLTPCPLMHVMSCHVTLPARSQTCGQWKHTLSAFPVAPVAISMMQLSTPFQILLHPLFSLYDALL